MSQLPQSLNFPEEENGEKASLLMGAIAGFLTAIICGVLWAVVTNVTHYKIGLVAVGIGLLVGFAVRYAGRGHSLVYGVVGAVLALMGCLLGNFLAVLLILSADQSIPLMELIKYFLSYPADILSLMQVAFEPIDLLFYGIALYEGFRFSMITPKRKPAAAVPSIST